MAQRPPEHPPAAPARLVGDDGLRHGGVSEGHKAEASGDAHGIDLHLHVGHLPKQRKLLFSEQQKEVGRSVGKVTIVE